MFLKYGSEILMPTKRSSNVLDSHAVPADGAKYGLMRVRCTTTGISFGLFALGNTTGDRYERTKTGPLAISFDVQMMCTGTFRLAETTETSKLR